ncbi:MAG: PspA/IM30 family protein [Chloroflexota bacterium]
MATLLEKVSTLISANLHALVDQALKANNLAVIDQYIRQVEEQLEDLEDAATTIGAGVKSLRRKVVEHQQKAAGLDRAIDAFLMEGNDASAAAAQSQLNSTQRLIATYEEQAANQDAEYQKLLNARVKLQARLETMKQQRVELQALLELTKSKETVVKTIDTLDDLAGSGDSDISRIAQTINARLDKATAATEMRAASLDEQIDRVLQRDAVQQQLDERKKKLSAPQADA